MLKKTISVALILLSLTSAAGCSGFMRKKFVRQKGEKKITPVFTPEVYETSFTTKQRYANHFAFWKSSLSEVIELLNTNDSNAKKMTTHASYALEELKQMQALLADDERIKIEPHLLELSKLVSLISDSSYVLAHKHTLSKELKHNYKEVCKNFSYSKMKNLLKE